MEVGSYFGGKSLCLCVLEFIMTTDIKSWLIKSGYPLELFVHQQLLKHNYICSKSDLYKDIESGQAREIDLIGYSHGDYSNEYSGGLRLVIECKQSEKPCLVLSEGSKSSARYSQLFGLDFIDHDIQSFTDALCSELRLNSSNYTKPKYRKLYENVVTGYSIVQAFSKSDKHLYQGIMGLAKAENYFYRESIEFFDEMSAKRNANCLERYPFELIIPVLVVDTQLYNVHLDENGELEITETSWTTINIRKPWELDSQGETTIQIVHKDSVGEFFELCKYAQSVACKLDLSRYIG